VPQSSLTPVASCLAGEIVDDLLEILRVLGEVLSFRPHVGVMEAVERIAERRKHLEGDVGLELRVVHGVLRIPGPVEGAAAERIETFPCEGMPPGHRETQMVFHPLAHDDLVGLVVAEGERIGAVRALIFDLRDVAEKAGAHVITPLMAG
jgi:hypothetical protein